MRIFKPFLYLLIIILMLVLVTSKRDPVLEDPLKTVVVPGTYTSMPYDELRRLIPEKLKYIKENSTFLEPYNKETFDFIESKVQSVGDEQLPLLLYSVPNTELGYYRIDPIQGTPEQLTSFQFEQGALGWFWIYGTFIDSAGNTASYMYYLIRMDSFSPDLRKKLGIPLANASYYFISAGVGRDNNWRFTPYKVCRGEYVIESDSVFSFKALDLPEGWDYALAMNGVGNFKLTTAWKDTTNKTNGFDVNLIQKREPLLDNPQGCSPCAGGAGTLYFSYTQMGTDGELTVDDSSSQYTGGTGWVDREWLNNRVSSVYLSLIANTTALFKDDPRGLGKYVWLNLHLGDTLQYMASGLFKPDEKIYKGMKFNPIANRYGPGTPQYKVPATAEILETVVKAGIEFPQKIKIELPDGTYILDVSKFDNSLSIDVTNNIHWNSSSIVYDMEGKMVGTGFQECNQFADNETYQTNMLKGMGLDTNAQTKAVMFSNGKLTWEEGMPSLVVSALIVIITLACIVLFFLALIKRKGKKPKYS
jgi:hypothetical protein